MTASNIERFDEIVGQAFAHLYQSFPTPIPLLAGRFVGEDNVIEPGGFTGAEPTKEAEFCVDCLRWLVDAGYIAVRDTCQFGLTDAVLTAKGLETLKAMPASLGAPIGERIVEAAKTEGREALRSLVGQALGMGLQLLAR